MGPSPGMHAALLQSENKKRVIELAISPTKKDEVRRVYALFEQLFNYGVLWPLMVLMAAVFVFFILYFSFSMTDVGQFYMNQVILWATDVDVKDQAISLEVRIHAGAMLMLKSMIVVTLASFITAKIHYNKKKRIVMNECNGLLNTLENREAFQLIADNDTMYPGKMAKSLLEKSCSKGIL